MLLYKLSSYAAILHLQYLWNPVWIFLEPLISSKNRQSVKRIHGVRILKNLSNSKAFSEPVKGKKRVEVGRGSGEKGLLLAALPRWDMLLAEALCPKRGK